MPLYRINSSNINSIKETQFKFEKEIQTLFEKNLKLFTGLDLVKSEFIIKNRRIDTLAFDPDTNGFVIIEFKRDKNFSVIDQGFAYLGLMLENIAEFIVEYNESVTKPLKRNDFDASQSRIMFVSPNFSETQIQAANFKDISIELWEIKKFENDTVFLNQIKKSSTSESIKPITEKSANLRSVADQIFVPTEEYHLNRKSVEVKELYYSYKNSILNLSSGIELRPKKQEIGFEFNGYIIADIVIQKSGLKLYINLRQGELDDPKKITRDVLGIGHWGNGDYEVKIIDTKNLEYVMSLVKQSVEFEEQI